MSAPSRWRGFAEEGGWLCGITVLTPAGRLAEGYGLAQGRAASAMASRRLLTPRRSRTPGMR